MSTDYIPWGDQWKAEVRKFRKDDLIDLWAKSLQENDRLKGESPFAEPSKDDFAMIHVIQGRQVVVMKDYEGEGWLVTMTFFSPMMGGMATVKLGYDSAEKRDAAFLQSVDAAFVEEGIRKFLNP